MSNELQNVRSLDVVAAEIRTLTGNMLGTVIEIGRRMVEAKQLLPHGEFVPWLQSETGYSRQTANNFMRLYEEYGNPQKSMFGAEVSNVQTFGHLTYSKALALLSVPESEREAFAQEVDAENISVRELKEAIAERDAALKRAEGAELALAEEKETSDALLEEADQLREQLKQLEERPVDVAVKDASEEQIQAAVDEALQKAEEQARKAREALEKKITEAAKEKTKLKEDLKNAEEQAKKFREQADSAKEAGRAEALAQADAFKQEAEKLKKELAMADPVVAEFKGVFGAASEIVEKLVAMADKAPENVQGNIRAAMKALGKRLAGE